MDKGKEEGGKRWSWLPAAMPGVARLVGEKRAKLGAAWVDECWKRSLAGEPGWFFAREGAIAVGTPDPSDPAQAHFAALTVTGSQALLLIRNPEVVRGQE